MNFLPVEFVFNLQLQISLLVRRQTHGFDFADLHPGQRHRRFRRDTPGIVKDHVHRVSMGIAQTAMQKNIHRPEQNRGSHRDGSDPSGISQCRHKYKTRFPRKTDKIDFRTNVVPLRLVPTIYLQ